MEISYSAKAGVTGSNPVGRANSLNTNVVCSNQRYRAVTTM